MRTLEKAKFLYNLFKSRLFNKRMPLAISWYLTHRCNLNCLYCGIPARYSPDELSTGEIFKVIDELSGNGTRVISFCGGEPLIREDIGNIIIHCRRKNISVLLISNGLLVKERIEYLKDVDLLRLSFDGCKSVHEYLRGEGTYEKLIEAAAIAKEHRIKVMLNVTLTRLNLPHLSFMLKESRELKIPIKFSPVKYIHSGTKNIEDLIPLEKDYQDSIDFILMEARRNRYILNSLPALIYLKTYPRGKNLKICVGGRIFCHIKPNGDMHPCEGKTLENPSNCLREGAIDAFNKLPVSVCSQCWLTSTLELNMIYLFELSTIKKAVLQEYL